MSLLSRYSGSLLEFADGKLILVFSVVQANPSKWEVNDSAIGFNLRTGLFDDSDLVGYTRKGIADISEIEYIYLENIMPFYRKMTRKTIAISGKARSGKDTMADRLEEKFGNSVKVPLASTINSIVSFLQTVGTGKNRELKIKIGQSMREYDKNIWIKEWLSTCYMYTKKNMFICSDMRQENEFNFFKNMGAVTVSILADDHLRLEKIAEIDGKQDLVKKLLNDETEQLAGSFQSEYIIENNYTEEYSKKIEDMIADLVIKKGW